ncbi:MAG: ABC transporter permease [Vicinamibacterales bacterium]
MIRLPGLSALDRKLLRDLWGMKGQALAVAAVIASGVTMFVTYLSNFDSLQRTQEAYYERQRFADVFASLKRAPNRLEERLRAIPGVEAVSTRVVADVTLDVPGIEEPATGRLVSLPVRGRPVLNDVVLRRGNWIDPARPDEVLASEAFTDANGLRPGDQVAAVINGRRRQLRIAGIVLSPEYVYSIRPGEIIPDNRRFGVFWMNGRALATAFDMEGAFNDVSLAVSPGGSEPEVIAALDRLLQPYGGAGAIPRRLQPSAWTLGNELAQLQSFGFVTPLIFLSVAAFILNVALTRAMALQRAQIAALKALGYSNAEVGWHYIKWALVIATVGAAGGVAAGAWLGAGMIAIYNDYFRFPLLDYRLSVDVAIGAVGGSLLVAALGAQAAVRRAVRIPPAEAMRPEPPALYRRSLAESAWITRRLTHATRMVLRNLERQPFRALASIVGIAFATAILVVGFAFIDVMDELIDQQFVVTMRQDATVTFVEPRGPSAVHAVARLPGVMRVEPQRSVPARLRSGPRSRTLAVTGLPARPALNRVVDRSGRVLSLPPGGLVLSKMLAGILDVAPGDHVRIEVLEGRRPVFDAPVASLVDDAMGLQAYMDIDALHRLLREGRTVSSVALTMDPSQADALYHRLKLVPAVAGVALTRLSLENFRTTLAENMNLMVFFNVFFAGIIAFGVVYNSARVSLSERSRELASLRVLGFTRAEISLILLGELAVVTTLALPTGAVIGYGLGLLMVSGLNNEVYRMPFIVTAPTVAWAFLTVIGATLVSALVVRRRLDHLDLVGVLKTRE